jgi:hypothetical protein
MVRHCFFPGFGKLLEARFFALMRTCFLLCLGRSIVPLIVESRDTVVPASTRAHVAKAGEHYAASWRSAQLIEYYGLGDVVRYNHLEDTYNNTFR